MELCLPLQAIRASLSVAEIQNVSPLQKLSKGMGTGFPRNDFWDGLGGQAFASIGLYCLEYHHQS